MVLNDGDKAMECPPCMMAAVVSCCNQQSSEHNAGRVIIVCCGAGPEGLGWASWAGPEGWAGLFYYDIILNAVSPDKTPRFGSVPR